MKLSEVEIYVKGGLTEEDFNLAHKAACGGFARPKCGICNGSANLAK